MANPKHLEILKQGVKVWNKWKERHPYTGIDLREANLRGLDLTEANLKLAFANRFVGMGAAFAGETVSDKALPKGSTPIYRAGAYVAGMPLRI